MTDPLPSAGQIAAIVPLYAAEGDMTSILLNDNTALLRRAKIKSVLYSLARRQAVDLARLRQTAGAYTCRSILQPLCLTPGLVLVPVKVRRPRIAGDASTGYVNLYAIAATEAAKNRLQSAVVLKTGGQLTVLWSLATLNSQVRNARLAVSGQSPALASPALQLIAYKLVDVFLDILALKREPP